MQFTNWTASIIRGGLLLAAFSLICIGCSRHGPARRAVRGSVTLDSQPASGVVVIFTPTSGGQAGAVAVVDDGQFTLDASVGPSVGKHDITLAAVEPDLEEFEQLRAAGQKPFSQIKLHPRYGKAGALSANVSQDDSNVFRFELSSR